ncbi:glycoside hydrolase [Phyllobacterium sp. 0TCS1.6C]|uniref:glycoside hydrolase n=1 Tax=unclassified Phyllobacterium TaxID=2638441 RepID=UPI002264FCCA|nr:MULTISPECIES: glycoside hydrolase [unclassified Phyllobacterium]MCX8281346.1 glycoside hydrolase [Phyllobacterium sp. 0TCS1.6C]MCX8295998.1 glycoside hydrolase [Phyllobacterium sp. 0TCS1.6A]
MSAITLPFLAAALASVALLAALRRFLPRGFLVAAVNERSNHSQPARQIGGLALVPVILVGLVLFGGAAGLSAHFLFHVCLAALLLWIIGFLDDRHHLPEYVRLTAQAVASILAIHGLGADFQLLPEVLPLLAERVLLVIALIYFINLTNFMDGLDLMVVSGLGIPLLAAAGLAAVGLAAMGGGLIAALAAGALAGFAFFNRPRALIFLGDSGSLPLGLLSGLVFFMLARDISIWIGLVLPLFFICDATSTLILRLLAGENIFAAHSKHAYQLARRAGWPVWRIIGSVAVLNLLLIVCAVAMADGGLHRPAIFVGALVLTGIVLRALRTRKPRAP